MDPHKTIIMKTTGKLYHTGNSHAIVLSPKELQTLGFKEGDTLTKSVEKGKRGTFLAIFKE